MANFSLTVLGAGVMAPTKERNPAGFLVEAAGKKILLDAGHGTIRRLVDYGFDFQNIDYVFISHFHTDHFADAFPLVHSRWVDDDYNKKSHNKLIILGPKGVKERFQNWRQIFWVEPEEDYPVKFQEGPNKLSLGEIQLETFPVKHVDWFSSLGIIIKSAGKKLVYTGDIGERCNFQELVEVCQGADVLVTEASYEVPTPNHYTIAQVKELADRAKVKKVLVVHIRPQHLERVREICQKERRFILGKDGLKIKV